MTNAASLPTQAGLAPGLTTVDALTPHLFKPTELRPLRAKQHWLSAHTKVIPHQHNWAQISISFNGAMHLTSPHGTLIAPQSHAVWIPAGPVHSLSMVKDADLVSVYLLQDASRPGPWLPQAQPEQARTEQECKPWQRCRVLEISPLLHQLIAAIPKQPDDQPPLDCAALVRERHISALILDELRRAREVNLGVNMPTDKRLLALCQAVVDDPTAHASLEQWAANTGASPRTVARLFQQQLGCTFSSWRSQVVLDHAVSLDAGNMPVQQIAAELGYGHSAFSAMVRRTVGMPPAQFFWQQ